MQYGTTGDVDNLKCTTLENELKSVIRAYSVREFRSEVVQVEIQFKDLKDSNLFGVEIDVLSRDEHVKNIETHHGVIKDLGRYYCAMLPFDSLPRMIVMNMFKTVVFYVNDFV